MDPMGLYMFAAGMGSIPVIWWSINRTRACLHKWWENRKYDRVKKLHEPQPIPYTGIEPEEYCLGCDEVRPKSWMAFVDEDGDGVPDGLYRCRVCRGVRDPVSSQDACNERMDEHFGNNRGDDVAWEIGPGKVVEVHEDSCQCTNCVGWQPLTEEQIENARMPQLNPSLDLSQILADYTEYTAAVAKYRSRGVNATNETDRKYRARLAKRDARRQALRAKYDMDGDGWRKYVRH